MTTFIALLRAVNVGGRKVEMAALRKVAEDAGYGNVRTYIASGNLLVDGKGSAKSVSTKLEAAIADRFGIDVPVIVRTAQEWSKYLHVPKQCAQAAREHPNHLLVAFPRDAPAPEAAKILLPRCTQGERILIQDDALWIEFTAGVAGSKLTPASIDKAMGSPTTARNLNTVRKLADLAGVKAGS